MSEPEVYETKVDVSNDSVEISRTSKGEYSFKVKCYTNQNRTIKVAQQLAEEIIRDLDRKYPIR